MFGIIVVCCLMINAYRLVFGVCWRLVDVCCVVDCCAMFVVSGLLLVRCSLFVVCCLLFGVCLLVFSVLCFVFGVHCLSFVV